jgi:hypothetical protein
MRSSVFRIDTVCSVQALSLVKDSAKTITDVINLQLAEQLPQCGLDSTIRNIQHNISAIWPELTVTVDVSIDEDPLIVDNPDPNIGKMSHDTNSHILVQVTPSKLGQYLNELSTKLQ